MSKFKSSTIAESGILKAKHLKPGDFIAYVGLVGKVEPRDSTRKPRSLMIEITEAVYNPTSEIVLIVDEDYVFDVTRRTHKKTKK